MVCGARRTCQVLFQEMCHARGHGRKDCHPSLARHAKLPPRPSVACPVRAICRNPAESQYANSSSWRFRSFVHVPAFGRVRPWLGSAWRHMGRRATGAAPRFRPSIAGHFPWHHVRCLHAVWPGLSCAPFFLWRIVEREHDENVSRLSLLGGVIHRMVRAARAFEPVAGGGADEMASVRKATSHQWHGTRWMQVRNCRWTLGPTLQGYNLRWVCRTSARAPPLDLLPLPELATDTLSSAPETCFVFQAKFNAWWSDRNSTIAHLRADQIGDFRSSAGALRDRRRYR